MSRQCFAFLSGQCRDRGFLWSLSRQRFPLVTIKCQVLQHVWPWTGILCHDRVFLCRDGVRSRPRDFMSRHRIFVSRQNFLEWCRDKVFYVTIGFCQDQKILCRDREFDVAIELPEIVSRQSIPYVVTESSKNHEVFHVAT